MIWVGVGSFSLLLSIGFLIVKLWNAVDTVQTGEPVVCARGKKKKRCYNQIRFFE